MDSFYGGKQGISFVIKDSFKTKAAMEAAFTDSTYNKTWYDQYVIIDADNKNDPDNGKIFRRTAYRGETASITNDSTVVDVGTDHAEYVGQVVGPAGGVPNVELVDLDQLENDFNALKEEGAMPSGSIVNYSNGNNTTTTTATVTAGNVIKENSSAIGAMYKSGADYTTTPTFKYGFYTFQGNTKQQDGTFPIAITKIGFEIPYIDFEFSSTVDVLPYSENTGSVRRMTEEEPHDFYRKYKLSIPRGAPGSYFSNFQKQTNNRGTDTWYNLNNIDYSNNTLKTDAQKTTVTSSSRIITGNYYYYDATAGTHIPLSDNVDSAINFYLWDAQEVTTITASTTPTNSDFGKLYISYSNNNNPSEFDLPMLRKLEAITDVDANEYKLKAYYGNSVTPTEIGNFARYFGVWAQPLEIDTTASATTPPTVTSAIIPSADQTSTNYPVGNLGVLKDNEKSYFYMWVPDDWNDFDSSGSWEFMGATDTTNISLDIIKNELDNGYKFNTKSTLNTVIFNNRNQPTSTSSSYLFGETPWN